jgi:uncharacterized alkaline shock family protein YloU/uncharacterized membrane protein
MKLKMKKLDKVILALFSAIIFLESILLICIILGWLNISVVGDIVRQALLQYNTSRIILIVVVVCLICAVKCIFFDTSSKEKSKSGVLMQNDNGKLLISKPTIENIVGVVVKDFDSVEDVSVSIDLDNLNNLIVNVNLVVSQDVIIKELTLNMQNKIKEAIKKTSDLEVKEVNVKIKNISTENEKK